MSASWFLLPGWEPRFVPPEHLPSGSSPTPEWLWNEWLWVMYFVSFKVVNSCLESHREVAAGGLQLGAVGLEAVATWCALGRAVLQMSRSAKSGEAKSRKQS